MDIEKIKQEAIEEYKKDKSQEFMLFAQQMNQVILEGMNTTNKKKFYKKYTPEQVEQFLLDPSKNEVQLRDMSRYLTVSSPQYWRLVNYLPSMAVLRPIVTPFDIDKVTKNKSKTTKMLKSCMKTIDNMSVQHEFLKVLQVAFREDTFYGYTIETNQSFFIKQLDPKYCRIKGKYDGCFTYEFNFSYFDNYPDELNNYAEIDNEFKRKYDYFKANSSLKWQELNLEKEVCIKCQETFDFSCPPYISVFNDLYDVILYKDINKDKFERENNTFLGLKMPIREGSNNDDDFSLSADTMKTYFAFIQSCLQNKVNLFMSPMDFESVSFGNKNSSQTNNDVIQSAITSFWSSTGVSESLFSGGKSANTLELSIKTDESLLFNVYRQIERWLSRKIKLMSDGMFKVTIPNLTYFNLDSAHDRYIKDAQYGFNGSITLVEATNGISQNEAYGLGFIENEILGKHATMIPVSSSHTQNSESESGRPTVDTPTESGEASREQQ